MNGKSELQANPGWSVALDIARFLLALCVAGAHWTQPFFQDRWPDLLPVAIAAVGAFFVLSGFTIRSVTAAGSFQLNDYLVRRFARLWSVMLPALLVTAGLDALSAIENPDFYSRYWHSSHTFLGLVTNALFLSQLWGADISPLSNSPFWSIGYEAWFYLFYGLVMSRRFILAAVAGLIAGPNILFLLPLWIFGLAIHDLLVRARTRQRQLALATTALLIAILIGGLLARYPIEARAAYHDVLEQYFGFFSLPSARVGMGLILPSAGVIFGLVLLALLPAIKARPPRVSAGLAKAARWLGEFTFPLYLLHLPFFVLCASVGFYDRTSLTALLGTFVLVTLVIALAVPLTERLKRRMQSVLGHVCSATPQRFVWRQN